MRRPGPGHRYRPTAASGAVSVSPRPRFVAGRLRHETATPILVGRSVGRFVGRSVGRSVGARQPCVRSFVSLAPVCACVYLRARVCVCVCRSVFESVS